MYIQDKNKFHKYTVRRKELNNRSNYLELLLENVYGYGV
jgi:hypothetical protein